MKGLILAVGLTTLAFIAMYNINSNTETIQTDEYYFTMTEEGFRRGSPNDFFTYNTSDNHPEVKISNDRVFAYRNNSGNGRNFAIQTTGPAIAKNTKATIWVR